MNRLLPKSRLAASAAGFTILELMIATSVFAIVLLVVAAGILHFTHDYIKGINSANTQAVARSIMSDVSQSLQFSASDPISQGAEGNQVRGYCVGSVDYIFKTGQVVEDTAHGLVQDTSANCQAGSDLTMPTSLASSQREQLSANMRLGNLSIQPGDEVDTYRVSVTVIYGGDGSADDADLLINTDPGDPNLPDVGGDWSDVRCRSNVGSQFCAVSTLTTTVQKRLSDSSL